MWLGKDTGLSRLIGFCTLLAVTVSVEAGDCKTLTVASGDSCAALASKCGVNAQQFTQYNSDTKLCSTLTPGQRVCCSSGTLPDITPKPGKDGLCASYVVKSGDTCSSIAAANGLTVDSLAKFNDKVTWGWSGCQYLGAQLAICLSTGVPPMPQTISNAICGPLKPGTKPPGPNQKLVDLNPCPLNACCTIWGQCGITPEYCNASTAATGNPGTASSSGQNGCISNCGNAIVNDKTMSGSFFNVGYYESWNFDRSCLNMRVDSIDTSQYSHVHWGFGTVGADLDVSINDTTDQWSEFTKLQGSKRIVSFGGWGFSTDVATYNIIRKAMKPENAGAFATNVVSFITKYSLDGVDFDWEYPGAPDIPGIPAGLESDAPNYLAFLKLLRSKMPKGKSISFAAPASYWYLKAFPVAEMAKVVDYIVYMTYDLHGQWDYGNKWSQEGCPGGNCLRSHVNLTETNYALAMITKAGVPNNKITVGVSSYGRAFGMAQPGCTGSMCPFKGPASAATPGKCTAAAGYISNAEINEIIASKAPGTKAWYDKESNSNIVVYGADQWVAYMDDNTKKSRTNYYKSLGFLGTVDWALDLQEYRDDDEGDPFDDDDDDDLPPAKPLPECKANFNTMEDLDAAAGSIPDNCKTVYTVATLSNVLNTALASYRDMMNDGYDGKFHTYAEAVADSAGSSVRDFVNKNGNKYFSCMVSETTICCDDCKNGGGDNPCGYCFDGTCYKTVQGLRFRRDMLEISNKTSAVNDNHDRLAQRDHPHPERVRVVKQVKVPEPCPPDYSQRGYGPNNPYEQAVYWTLLPDKTDQFFADLLGDTGVAKDKIKMQDYDRGNGCPPSAKADDDCWGIGMDYGIPMPAGYGTADVANPKDVVQKALANSNDLGDQLASALLDLRYSAYDGDDTELVDAISIPVLMIADAVDSMNQVETIADKIDEEKKKALILAFIGALLFFIPIAGEVLGSVAELSDIAAILAVVSAVGDTAMGVYSIVEDPKNPLLGIMSIILAPLALTSLTKISAAANLRRSMSDDDILKLGGKIGARMQTIKKIVGRCNKSL